MKRQLGRLLRAVICIGLLIVACGFGAKLHGAAPYGVDAVEELRQVLRQRIRDSMNPDEITARKSALEQKVKALRIGDYRRALALDSWRNRDPDPTIAAVDQEIRQKLIDTLTTSLRQVLKQGAVPAKLAAITEIAEMGTSVRAGQIPANLKLTEQEQERWARGGLARQFAPDLIALCGDSTGNSTVREFAARALGKINPEPRAASAALEKLLTSGTVGERRAAGDGLVNLLDSLVQVRKIRSTTGADVTSDDVALADRFMVASAGRGVADADATVRRICLDAIRLGANTLHDEVIELPESQRQEFPAPGRKLTDVELAEIRAYRDSVVTELRMLLPVAEALAGQVAVVAPATEDGDAEVRVLACHALEAMGHARARLRRKATSIPPIEEPKEVQRKEQPPQPIGPGAALIPASAVVRFAQANLPAKDLLAADPLGQPLQRTLPLLAERAVGDPRPHIRLAAVDAIEPISRDAAPIVPTLARGLRDPNTFVRWATSRVIGKAGAVDTELTVPLLVSLLCDEDLDAELSAANALGLFGPAASAAVPALAAAVEAGDAERRVAAIHSLQSIGKLAESAVPALTNVLAFKDVRVRRAAAEALTQFGPAARSATAALERALRDTDADVRKFAADALLAIAAGK